MRRIILIIIIALVSAMLALAVYFGFGYFQPPQAEPGREEKKSDEEKLSADPLKEEVGEEVINYWFGEDGRLYFAKINGEISGLTRQEIENFNGAQPSASGSWVLAQFSYPVQPIFTILNIGDQSWIPLPNGTISADWHPTDDNKIAYLQNGVLKIRNLVSKKEEAAFKISFVDVIMDWLTPDEILFSDRPSSFYNSQSWIVNIKTGGVSRPEKNPLILLPKCASLSDKTYCALSGAVPNGLVMPDDYLKRRYLTSDDFYLNNELFYQNTGKPIDAVDLKIESGRLYFINRWDQKLYSLPL